jgi:hypothetical protein
VRPAGVVNRFRNPRPVGIAPPTERPARAGKLGTYYYHYDLEVKPGAFVVVGDGLHKLEEPRMPTKRETKMQLLRELAAERSLHATTMNLRQAAEQRIEERDADIKFLKQQLRSSEHAHQDTLVVLNASRDTTKALETALALVTQELDKKAWEARHWERLYAGAQPENPNALTPATDQGERR